MSTTEEIIGRSDVDDLEAILTITNTDVDAVSHVVKDNADAIFTWDYERARPALGKLYEKAKTSQWNAATDLDWSIDVDQEKEVLNAPNLGMVAQSGMVDLSGVKKYASANVSAESVNASSAGWSYCRRSGLVWPSLRI